MKDKKKGLSKRHCLNHPVYHQEPGIVVWSDGKFSSQGISDKCVYTLFLS